MENHHAIAGLNANVDGVLKLAKNAVTPNVPIKKNKKMAAPHWGGRSQSLAIQ